MNLRPLPIESPQPMVAFAVARLALVVLALLVVAALGFPYDGRLVGVLGGAALPWSVAMLVLARRDPERALHPIFALGDLAVLLAIELVVPETYAAVRFAALLLIAVHADFQGEGRGLVIAALGVTALIAGSAIRGEGPVPGHLLPFYESVFAIAALAAGLLPGRARSAESASRVRARRLTRRTIEGEREVRRRVASAIHDGPVQELIGLDMVISAARRAAASGDGSELDDLLGEAHRIAERNVETLRDEIVDLGPYAFEELGYEGAIENCLETWRRRYGVEVRVQVERLKLPPEVAADLFYITQEAVVNAGRHAHAENVSISVRQVGPEVELRVADDGQGFGDVDPLGASEPGHLGLAGMRERAELLGGRLEIESSPRGTRVLVRAPMRERAR